MDASVTGLGARLRTAVTTWHPRTPPLADDLAHYVDRTRPTTAVAAYPGGVVPDDAPEARIG